MEVFNQACNYTSIGKLFIVAGLNRPTTPYTSSPRVGPSDAAHSRPLNGPSQNNIVNEDRAVVGGRILSVFEPLCHQLRLELWVRACLNSRRRELLFGVNSDYPARDRQQSPRPTVADDLWCLYGA